MTSPDALRTGLDDAAEEARRAFAAWAALHVAPHAGAWDRAAHTPPEAIRAVAAAGFLGAVVPEDAGGRAMDPVAFGVLNEELGRACSSIRSLVTVHSMVCQAVARWGSPPQRARWLPRLASGELVGAFGLSEPEVGSDAAAVRTVARPSEGGYLLHGRKRWTTYGRAADLLLTFAACEGKPLALLVELDAPGVRVEPVEVAGTRASMLAEITFDGAHVPAENRLAGPGFGMGVALSALELGRYSVAWGAVGVVRACLEAAAAYAAGRVQGGSPIGEHQLVAAMLADMATDYRAARLLSVEAGVLRRGGAGSPSAGRAAFHAKYFASRAATRAALAAVQIHGANGLTDAFPVERYLRDSRVLEIIEGSTQIQQVTLGAWALDEWAVPAA